MGLDAIELPVCDRATAISMETKYHSPRLRPHASAGASTTFAALRVLTIGCSAFDTVEMVRLVSSLCPRLQDLTLATHFDGVSDFSVRSEMLERLELCLRVAGRLTVETPRLVRLAVSGCFRTPVQNPQYSARVAAPKLADVSWRDVYDPLRHQFVEALRHLRKLRVWPCFMPQKSSHWNVLLRRFDAVDELELYLSIRRGKIPYKLFLKDTAKLPKCKVLKIRFIDLFGLQHCTASILLHLISKCTGIRTLDIRVDGQHPPG
ncbi:hypothetical protein E2562_000950 [Oryza meyeriana var. granulata]|uniref:F-box/LRR-repeat protein 15/At3g58940/PEG3-like LRR domain-containing protein n=1 Tax=Oryza meyeriana var. granulata TaxID=110450 RepID=A0A6G1CZ24_9ORYZ|nr:hypothetical protein E2562_000950 [Oryza meyeriana var. granulata]